MGDPSSSRNGGVVGGKVSVSNQVGSSPRAKTFLRRSKRHIALLGDGNIFCGPAGNAALFLLKVAALETVRRVSKTKYPFVWRSLQALQVICYPPLKWIQRWAPFKGLVQGLQVCSYIC